MPKCTEDNCKAEIRWIRMATGGNMPIDVKPIKMIQIVEGQGRMIDVYMNHWATCTDPDKFKRGEKHGDS